MSKRAGEPATRTNLLRGGKIQSIVLVKLPSRGERKMVGSALHEVVAKTLRDHPDKQFTPEQAALLLIDLYPDRFKQKESSLGSREALVWQLTREIYAQRPKIVAKHKDIAVDLSKRPMRLFVAKERSADTAEAVSPSDLAVAQEAEKEEYKEHALYEPLQRFLADEMQILSKRIRESTSKNRRGKHGNKWLHPDIVGLSAPGSGWSDLIKQCAIALPTRKAQLISVEVKTRLTVGNIRECFFQTVSNSLWANQAFLAAAEVSGESTWAELRMLCALHGIGFISIDPETHSESRVLIPPRERDEIDWASAERISQENADFQDFLTNVLNYLTTGHVMQRLWDFPTT